MVKNCFLCWKKTFDHCFSHVISTCSKLDNLDKRRSLRKLFFALSDFSDQLLVPIQDQSYRLLKVIFLNLLYGKTVFIRTVKLLTSQVYRDCLNLCQELLYHSQKQHILFQYNRLFHF